MYRVTCPYCKRRQSINGTVDEINKYYDCEYCLETFEIIIKLSGKEVKQQLG